MMTHLPAEVTFILSDNSDVLERLSAKAREIDLVERGEDDTPDSYTLAQALAVVWATEPAWLHEHVLVGWTLEKASDPNGLMLPPFAHTA